MNYLIFGVDPGTTTAIAAIDLEGKLVSSKSEKHMGLDGAIRYMTSVGRPALIATDVSPPPEFVLKLAASLGAPIHFPKKPMLIEEKIELTRGRGTSDAHERDALAAALNAFAHYENKLRKIDARNLGDDAKIRAFAGEKITDDEISEPEKKLGKKPKTFSESEIEGLRRRITKTELELGISEKKIAELERLLSVSESKLKSAYDERAKEASADLTVKTLRTRINELERELTERRKLSAAFEKAALGELKPIGVYPKIFGGLTLLRKRIEKEDLAPISKAKIVFTDVQQNKSVLQNLKITVLDTKRLLEAGGSYFIEPGDIAPPKEEKKLSLDNLVSDYRSRR